MVQSFFGTRPPAGYPGMVVDLSPHYDRSYLNTASDVSGVVTVTVATYAASFLYEITINGAVITHTSPTTGGTLTTVKDALVAAVNQSFAGVDAVSTGAATFTITGQLGQVLTVVPGTNLTSVVSTSVVTSGDIGLGLAVVRIAGDNDREARLGAPTDALVFLGVTRDNGQLTNRYPYSDAAHAYKRGDVMVVRETGTIYAVVEADVTPNDPVYFRYAGTGVVGAFSKTAVADETLLLPTARYLTTSSDGVVQVLLGSNHV